MPCSSRRPPLLPAWRWSRGCSTKSRGIRACRRCGKAVLRGGDVFGAAVNLAARVSAEAYAGEVLGTKPIEDAAREAGIPVAELGPVPLKNVRDLVPLY